MPSRVCRLCDPPQVIPSAQYEAHRQAHKNQGKAPHWTAEGARNRRKALKRDGYRCQNCGRPKEVLDRLGVELHVHHLRPGDDSVEALQTLCADCHPRGAGTT